MTEPPKDVYDRQVEEWLTLFPRLYPPSRIEIETMAAALREQGAIIGEHKDANVELGNQLYNAEQVIEEQAERIEALEKEVSFWDSAHRKMCDHAEQLAKRVKELEEALKFV